MRREVISGLVTKIEPVNRFLTFVTLRPISEDGWVETKIPVYMEVKVDACHLFVDKPVDIITTRSGFLGRKVRQEVVGSNFNYGVELTQSQINAITADYRAKEFVF